MPIARAMPTQLQGPELDTLVEALKNIDYVVFGTFKAPYLIEGGKP